jgi:hypothetical protein
MSEKRRVSLIVDVQIAGMSNLRGVLWKLDSPLDQPDNQDIFNVIEAPIPCGNG